MVSGSIPTASVLYLDFFHGLGGLTSGPTPSARPVPVMELAVTLVCLALLLQVLLALQRERTRRMLEDE